MEYGVKTTWDGQLRDITNTSDRFIISIWLGHESIETTQIYLNANLVMEDEILAKKDPVKSTSRRYRPGDRLLFLSSL
jgi:integrase